jgi:16S rRNA (guanine966-N2)-methyltransferase
VTRIIAGTLGGRRIAVPPKGTRPTTDRVREAIFSSLDHENRLRGARVLDAFAGSGALGLEALSRGAARATFLESHAAAARIIRANATSLGLGERSDVVTGRVLPWLERSAEVFDVALVDPPYDLPPGELTATLAALGRRISDGGAIVLEWSSRGVAPTWPPSVTPVAAKKYGETTVHYAIADGGPGASADSLDA